MNYFWIGNRHGRPIRLANAAIVRLDADPQVVDFRALQTPE
jgi:hypothetical protein